MRSIDQMTQSELWAELFCRIARIEDKLEISEEDEPMPVRVRDSLREALNSVPRICATCAHELLAPLDMPCKECCGASLPKWEPKEQETLPKPEKLLREALETEKQCYAVLDKHAQKVRDGFEEALMLLNSAFARPAKPFKGHAPSARQTNVDEWLYGMNQTFVAKCREFVSRWQQILRIWPPDSNDLKQAREKCAEIAGRIAELDKGK